MTSNDKDPKTIARIVWEGFFKLWQTTAEKQANEDINNFGPGAASDKWVKKVVKETRKKIDDANKKGRN